MAREKDIRISAKRVTAAPAAAARTTFEFGNNHSVTAESINAMTGSPRALAVSNAPKTEGSFVQQALDYINGEAKAAFAMESKDYSEFAPDPHVQRAAGKHIVHLHQRFRGIPIFQMSRSVEFGAENRIEWVVGNTTRVPAEVDVVPKLDAVTAVKIAAQYLATNQEPASVDHWGQPLELPTFSVPANYQPEIVSRVDSPTLPTTIAQGPFGDEPVLLLNLFDVGGVLRLVWHLTLMMPMKVAQYLMLIAADRPFGATVPVEDYVLYCRNTVSTATPARGAVFQHNPRTTPRIGVNFPRPSSEYPLSKGKLPTPFPPAWWVTKDETSGNCTIAVKGTSQSTLRGTLSDDTVVFDPADETGDEQKLLNIFYFCNFMHDFLYMLGFDEEAGNFQFVNFTDTGSSGDPVVARAHPGTVFGTANMITPPDGQSPEMNMGLVEVTARHTAFDSDVVFHEYCHGLSNRLIGGRMATHPLLEPQSGAMGEGWSDYFALTIQNRWRNEAKTVLGDWVVNRPDGIRSAPYDEGYAGKFGDIGTGIYNEVHNVGEIWCAALMQMNRELGAALGDTNKGHELAWQIVVDGMKLTPANPNFLDARDGILRALEGMHASGAIADGVFVAVRKAAWKAFARFGMGNNASSDGAGFNGTVGDESMPPGI